MSKEADYTSPQQKPEPAEEAAPSESISTEADQTSLQQKQESGEEAQTAGSTSKQAGQTLTYQKQKSKSEDAQTESVSQDADRPWYQKQESDEDAQTESVSEEADQTPPQQKQDSEKDAQTESAPKNNAGPSEVNNIIKNLVQQLPKISYPIKLPPAILLPTDLITFETILIEENSTGRISMTPKSQIATTDKVFDLIPGKDTRDKDNTVIVRSTPNPSADSFEQEEIIKEISSRRILMTPGKQIATKDEVTDITPREHTRAKDTTIVECPPSPSADSFAQVAVDRTKTFDSISVCKVPKLVVIEQSPVDKEKETETGPSTQQLNEFPGRKRYAETGSLKQSPRVQDETEMHVSKKRKDTT